MSEIDLSQKFPDMEPIKGPPSLHTINGFGLSVYGSRDRDEETGTYVKTQCIVAALIPILWLRSFRVADAEGGGWYFLGRVPMSRFTRTWNLLVLAAIFGTVAQFVSWGYLNSPEKVAARQMTEASEHEAAGRAAQAAQLYAEVAGGEAPQADEAATRLRGVVETSLKGDDPAKAAKLVSTARRVRVKARQEQATKGLLDPGLALVDAAADGDPRGARRLLSALEPLAPKGADFSERHERLLEALVVAEPDDPGPASDLAVLLEKRGETDRLEGLLAPHAARLGSSHGARILGLMRLEEGRGDEARELLLPYVKERMTALRKAEKSYDKYVQSAWDKQIEKLNASKAAPSWYAEYERSDEARQNEMVNEWVWERLDRDPQIDKRQKALMREAEIVPVALDVGILVLEHAQGLSDPEERKAELETAESLFLAMQGVAGDSDEFRISFARTQYWLGKPKKGRALFEELLESHDRDADWLVHVARTLRELGAREDARELAEEAHEKAGNDQTRFAAARTCSLLAKDADDTILWLERSDQSQVEVRASLLEAKGDRAWGEGDRGEAARLYRQAVKAWGSAPESAATKNNTAIVHLSLYKLTGARKELARAAKLMEEAVALEPESAILASNAADFLMDSAAADAIGDSIDLQALGTGASSGLLDYLYDDRDTEDALREAFLNHARSQRSRELLRRVLVTAPKMQTAYWALLRLTAYDDEDGLRDLERRLVAADLDFTAAVEVALEYYTSEPDEEDRTSALADVEHRREVLASLGKKQGVTRSVAESELAESLLKAHVMGASADPDEMVRLAESAHARSPSSETLSTLQGALLYRAGERLSGASPKLAELGAAHERSLSWTYLLPVVMDADEQLRPRILGDADVKRCVELGVKEARAFAPRQAPWNWALLRHAEPGVAESVAADLAADGANDARLSVRLRLNPAGVPYICSSFWNHLAKGERKEALQVLADAEELGVPLPYELIRSGT